MSWLVGFSPGFFIKLFILLLESGTGNYIDRCFFVRHFVLINPRAKPTYRVWANLIKQQKRLSTLNATTKCMKKNKKPSGKVSLLLKLKKNGVFTNLPTQVFQKKNRSVGAR